MYQYRDKYIEQSDPLWERIKGIKLQQYTKPGVDKTTQRPENEQFIPENCMLTTFQQQMFYAWRAGGPYLLAVEIWNLANERFNAGDTMWKYINNDRQDPRVLPFLIMTMHPEVVENIILGTLTYRYHSDAEFRHEVSASLIPETCPGVYLNHFFQTGAVVGQGQSMAQHEGKGFSYNQLKEIEETMAKYASDGRLPGVLTLVKGIDSAYTHTDPKKNMDYVADPNARKYLSNASQRTILQEWRMTMKRKVFARGCTKPDEPCIWSPSMVGIGVSCGNRLKDHTSNESTTALFSLFNATVKYLYGGQFDIEQYQILYIVDVDHTDLSEAALSVMASSYWDFGGLNSKRGGASTWKASDWAGVSPGTQENVFRLFKYLDHRRRSGWLEGFEYAGKIVKSLEHHKILKEKWVDVKTLKQATVDMIDAHKQDHEVTTKKLEVYDVIARMEKLEKLLKVVIGDPLVANLAGDAAIGKEELADDEATEKDETIITETILDEDTDDEKDDWDFGEMMDQLIANLQPRGE